VPLWLGVEFHGRLFISDWRYSSDRVAWIAAVLAGFGPAAEPAGLPVRTLDGRSAAAVARLPGLDAGSGGLPLGISQRLEAWAESALYKARTAAHTMKPTHIMSPLDHLAMDGILRFILPYRFRVGRTSLVLK
jgi:hypothetical protein